MGVLTIRLAQTSMGRLFSSSERRSTSLRGVCGIPTNSNTSAAYQRLECTVAPFRTMGTLVASF